MVIAFVICLVVLKVSVKVSPH